MIFEKLAALIAEQFNVDADSITMETSFTDDLNADSVDILDLSMALEEEFGIEELGEEASSPSSSMPNSSSRAMDRSRMSTESAFKSSVKEVSIVILSASTLNCSAIRAASFSKIIMCRSFYLCV